ncbi:hypothetical protein BASA60_011399 [Batrachochytrium salamandrivorans]|nr:hypothetical protein BASA60_011399 [Batrachochytrium salamandrivorans]
MISLYGLFILLLTAGTIHAQGDTDDDDSVDQAPKSKPNPKKATSSLQRANSLRLPKALRRLEAPYQRSTSAPADLQLDEECTGAHWMKVLSKPCPRQPSQPGSQTSTLHALSQSGEMPPTYLSKSEVESYRRGQKTDQYTAFIESEENYFTSTYSPKKKLGQGKYGRVYLATRNSDGLKVAYKSISKRDVEKYALESSPPPICNLRNSPVRSKKPSVAQCMSSRPPNLLLPHEFLLQTYLSQPGHENPYVPMTFDYIALKDVFILVMEYFDGKWMSLSKYVRERGRLDISDFPLPSIVFQGVTWDSSSWLECIDQIEAHPFAYFVVECEQVTGHRIQSGLVPEIQKSRLRLLGRALDPGVENVYTWLRGGVLNGEADLDQLWLDGDCGA